MLLLSAPSWAGNVEKVPPRYESIVQVLDVEPEVNTVDSFKKTFPFTRPSGYRSLSLVCDISDDGGTNATFIIITTASPASSTYWSANIAQCPADAQCDLIDIHRSQVVDLGAFSFVDQVSTGFTLLIIGATEAHLNEYKACALHSIK